MNLLLICTCKSNFWINMFSCSSAFSFYLVKFSKKGLTFSFLCNKISYRQHLQLFVSDCCRLQLWPQRASHQSNMLSWQQGPFFTIYLVWTKATVLSSAAPLFPQNTNIKVILIILWSAMKGYSLVPYWFAWLIL